MSLNLVQIYVKPRELARFAQSQGLDARRDTDQGYVCHAWLQALFGSRAPKPFRLFERTAQGGRQQLLGYTRASAEQLRECLALPGNPLAAEAIDETLFACKGMPAAWSVGQRFAFEVVVCPIVRQRNDGPEKDAFLAALDYNPDANREEVYFAWLARQFGDAAEPESIRLEGFQRVKMLRRKQVADDQSRTLGALERPRALFSGVVRVKGADSFGTLLARGVGRHRSFGYGMLTLRST